MAQIEKQRLAQELEIQKERVELERFKFELEQKGKERETALKFDLEKSLGERNKISSTNSTEKNIKLP